ncbi:MAG: hypothetical protein QG666_563 [Euryarchaeota archaeon]|nr:hypothetical protein [Euryarchaeota archaeon]
MTDREALLEAAAKDIDLSHLEEAKTAIADTCQEYIRWVQMFSSRLESLPDEKLHKFARAFSLTMLGHLPTRPGTCPFCIQYGGDRSCTGCGYAVTHGRCDADDSKFSLFIESFLDLGKLILQDTTAPDDADSDPNKKKRLLHLLLGSSGTLASQMQESLPALSTLQFMQEKQIYISRMVGFIPLSLLSDDVTRQFRVLQDRLKGYW